VVTSTGVRRPWARAAKLSLRAWAALSCPPPVDDDKIRIRCAAADDTKQTQGECKGGVTITLA
jgi:hypothetical protein